MRFAKRGTSLALCDIGEWPYSAEADIQYGIDESGIFGNTREYAELHQPIKKRNSVWPEQCALTLTATAGPMAIAPLGFALAATEQRL